MKTMVGSEWVLPEAPTYFKEKRRCAKCQKKVMKYQGPMPGSNIVLCYGCQRGFIDSSIEKPKLTLRRWVNTQTGSAEAKSVPRQRPGFKGRKVPGLKVVRAERDWTHRRLSEETGFSENVISKWEREINGVSNEKMLILMAELDCTEKDLTG